MRILYPVDPLDQNQADGPYKSEFNAMKAAGVNCTFFDCDMMPFGEFRPKPKLETEETIIYRGWMMNPATYHTFEKAVSKSGAKVLTDLNTYLSCHHLINWYDECKDLTAPTLFFDKDADFETELRAIEWDGFFVKDYVKSNNDSRGSVAKTSSEIKEIVSLIEKYRGAIEGGVAVREFQKFKPDTEKRYFIFNQKAIGLEDEIPDIVVKCAKRMKSSFFTIDVAQLENGELQIVELGDGQVSELKELPLDKFVKLMQSP